MANVVFRVIEQHPDHRLVYAAYVRTEGMPLEIQLPLIDVGSPTLNEAAILRAALGFATDLVETLRCQLAEPARVP